MTQIFRTSKNNFLETATPPEEAMQQTQVHDEHSEKNSPTGKVESDGNVQKQGKVSRLVLKNMSSKKSALGWLSDKEFDKMNDRSLVIPFLHAMRTKFEILETQLAPDIFDFF